MPWSAPPKALIPRGIALFLFYNYQIISVNDGLEAFIYGKDEIFDCSDDFLLLGIVVACETTAFVN